MADVVGVVLEAGVARAFNDAFGQVVAGVFEGAPIAAGLVAVVVIEIALRACSGDGVGAHAGATAGWVAVGADIGLASDVAYRVISIGFGGRTVERGRLQAIEFVVGKGFAEALTHIVAGDEVPKLSC